MITITYAKNSYHLKITRLKAKKVDNIKATEFNNIYVNCDFDIHPLIATPLENCI